MRKESKKRRKKCYRALEFGYDVEPKEISAFLDNLGKLEVIEDYSMWIETGDGRKICSGQILLRDCWNKRILSFDPIIFYDWFEIYGKGS
jgi:hypothetical protein